MSVDLTEIKELTLILLILHYSTLRFVTVCTLYAGPILKSMYFFGGNFSLDASIKVKMH
jgi:hypothetical protein